MIDRSYLEYPRRRLGPDHDRFPMRYLRDAPTIIWPGGHRVALWITVMVEFFPMDMGRTPFLPAGGVTQPYPAVWDYAGRDYGNRVGIFRLLDALEENGLKATAAVNSVIAERYPYLLAEIVKADWEIMASGTDMGELLYGGRPEAEEERIVANSLSVLRKASGQAIRGWHSPAYSQSSRTPDLLKSEGVEYVTDWVNDDMPYEMATAGGPLLQMPLTWFLSDQKLLFEQQHRIEEYETRVQAAFEVLAEEAERTRSARILSLVLTPYVLGQPYRIAGLRRLLSILASAGIWSAHGGEIAEAWRRLTGANDPSS